MYFKQHGIGIPPSMTECLKSAAFKKGLREAVIKGGLDVNPDENSAEYYVLDPEVSAPPEGQVSISLTVHLEGVNRGTRSNKMFHETLQILLRFVSMSVSDSLEEDNSCQVSCVIHLDGDIENPAGSGNHTRNVESVLTLVMGKMAVSS